MVWFALLAGCLHAEAPGTSIPGDGVAFGGGDILLERLEVVRLTLADTFSKLRSGVELAVLCQDSSLGFSSNDERAQCRAFLTEGADRFLEVLDRETDSLFQVSTTPLVVQDARGNRLEMAARTELGPKGPIALDPERAGRLSTLELVELIGHELGHKVPWRGHFIDDVSPIGASDRIGGGRAFLNLVGLALRVYALRINPYFSTDLLSQRLGIRAKGALQEGDFFPTVLDARLYSVRLVRPFRNSSRLYLFEDLQRANPPTGAFWLLKQPDYGGVLVRVLRVPGPGRYFAGEIIHEDPKRAPLKAVQYTVTEKVPDRRDRSLERRSELEIGAAVGYRHTWLADPLIGSFSMHSIDPSLRLSYELPGGTLLGGSVGLTGISASQTGATQSARFFDLDGHVSFALCRSCFVSYPIALGWTLHSLLMDPFEFGYQNLTGPYASTGIAIPLGRHDRVELLARAGLLFDGFKLRSLAENELTAIVFWYRVFDPAALGIELYFSRLAIAPAHGQIETQATGANLILRW